MIIAELEKLVEAHKSYNLSRDIFCKKTGVELCDSNKNIQLYGDQVELMVEIGAKVDPADKQHLSALFDGVGICLVLRYDDVRKFEELTRKKKEKDCG
ncbi:MAG: hypothetical protein ACTSW1_08350 [Candidatus Hodarchaeales archaeon]